jgi:hypothetical protein
VKCPADYPELADYLLQAFVQVCQEHGLSHFITAGTCLGFCREGTYIPDDNDIDVAVAYTPEAYNGFPLFMHQRGIITDTHGAFENRHYWKDDMLLDITWVNPTGFYASCDYIKGYPVPSPVEEYLAWKYGDAWRTPMRTGYPSQHEE